MSPDPYHHAFKEELDLCKLDIGKHKTAGLSFFESNGRLLLAAMSPHTPGAQIPRWCINLCGAWIIQINDCWKKRPCLPLSILKHTRAYPQVSGHLGGNQDPADKRKIDRLIGDYFKEVNYLVTY